ncbi:hypothetical protein GCM10009127_03250 [Alteraurantiacibacter aestuarii]|uniref:Methyltransferase domain-containing protein n=1 Tax=Alteraurantiacibacter aestuarii TaxID=650004 RepID=A0A844ZIW3_9SPHN|nr:methyltransferase domain-containing protein [Alteraurantiacibacter aestuarii]MXO88421.1 methyltransferase domain-containing protein [Alteraurantiacibacter aestuarii]
MSAILEEHQEYMSLTGRYDRYSAAIEKVIKSGDVVADLGCGFGVLGIQCLEAGASQIYGIDHSDAIEIARESVKRAGLADRYTCIRGSSFSAVLPEKVDVLICDHVGFFGVDYGIMEMVLDARRRFLKPGGRIVPRRITLMISAVQSPECRAKVDFWDSGKAPAVYQWLSEQGVNTKYQYDFPGAQLCAQPVTLGDIDLHSDIPENLSFSATLLATRDAQFDGLVGWFNCEIAEDVWMTNSPLDEQAIERPNAFFPCSEPFQVRAGDEIGISIRVRQDAETIAWTIRPPNGAPRQKMSTWQTRILAPQDLAENADTPLRLNTRGEAHKAILALIDGQRTMAQIEDAMLASHANLFSTETLLRRFVRQAMAKDTS